MKQFIRNFRKQQTVGLLNICSLSLGIMVATIVGLWAINELSFDKFHKNKDRIYRSVLWLQRNDEIAGTGGSFKPYGEQAQAEFPVIEDMCRVNPSREDIRINDILYPATQIFITDANFFNFFTFALKEGNVQQVLSSPDRVVISESAVAKYFAGQNPVGQIIRCRDTDFAVSGVMKDIPNNSSLQSDFVFPFFGWTLNADWGNNDSFMTFFLLQNSANTDELAAQLTQMIYKSFEPFKSVGATVSLQPLSDLHFNTEILYDRAIKGNKSLIGVFVLTAIAILIISCINFANLFVSTSFIRAKAVGVKKAVGAKMMDLMRGFYWETACYVIVSIAVGLLLTAIIMPVFNNFLQSGLTLDFTTPRIYIFLAGLFIFVVALAGSYPALYITRFNVVAILFGKFKGKNISFFQKSLIIAQFTASITLLIVVGCMLKQVNYIISYDLGFNKVNVMYVQGRGALLQDFKSIEGEFLSEPSITGVTLKNALPTVWNNGSSVKKIPDDNGMDILMERCYVNPNYFDFFEMKIIDGENPFFLESATESDVVINESAARLLGYEQPVGELIDLSFDAGIRSTIRGVVRDAYTKSLHQTVDPQIYIKHPGNRLQDYLFFKISGDPGRAISFIKQKWDERVGDYPFEYHFLDDTYKQLYTSEMNSGKVLAFTMLITLIITVAGLFAMTYYATQRRLKEVAIRKVYGASIKDIFVLLNKDFLLLVTIAFLIACPLAYYGLYKWLEGFAVKTSLSVWAFLSVGVIALLVTLLTTGYQTWKTATENPVKAIKN